MQRGCKQFSLHAIILLCIHSKMYATNLIRVFCKNSSILSRPLLSSCKCLKSNNLFVHILNDATHFESNLSSKSLTRVSFATHCSPDDEHNVSKEKSTKKRRRIVSNSSSSDEGENSSPTKAESVK